MQIEGKRAVIVGGASGMAKSSAEMLRERGASIAILENPMLNGTCIRLDAGQRFAPK